MIAMAISDIVILWVYFPLFLWNISSAFRLAYHTKANKRITTSFMIGQGWIQETFMQFCDWVLLTFSLERLIAVLKPLWTKKLTSASTANTIVVILFVLSVIFSVEEFVKQLEKGQPRWIMKWDEVQFGAEMTMVFVKFFGLLIINAVLIMAIAKRQHRDIGRVSARLHRRPSVRTWNTNILLLSSAVLYLIAMFSSLCVNSLALADTLGVRPFDESAKKFATPFCNITLLTNYSINFFLYLTVSHRYRAEFRRTVLSIKRPVEALKNSIRGTVTGSQRRRSGREHLVAKSASESRSSNNIPDPSGPSAIRTSVSETHM
ncbi:uncharacterized protein LOC129598726 isoform X2 [Paramacrobiotus metropolitanus]|nr:uncharacterized protein LOC129598726 isoform X2 [Paramacrobiotus metropolitanus]